MIQLYTQYFTSQHNSTTRGNPLKLCTYRPKYDLCKYNFTVRVISLWNSLPSSQHMWLMWSQQFQ